MASFRQTILHEIEVPQLPANAPFIFDDASLAGILRIRNKTLWWLLRAPNKQYTKKLIPKKKGLRVIHAPKNFMKYTLRQAYRKILAPLQEQLGPHVTAYRKERSARMAVLRHIPPCPVCAQTPIDRAPIPHDCPKQGTCIQLDLKDFFSSTRRSWVRNYFKHLGYSHTVAGYLSSLLTVTNIPNSRYVPFAGDGLAVPKYVKGVPQGAPTSGALCNLVADWKLDQPILSLLDGWNAEDPRLSSGIFKWQYSRYADDLTFTVGVKLSPAQIDWCTRQIISVIRSTGYRVNAKKTRCSGYWTRKQMLGITFNRHPNYPKHKARRLRAIVNNCVWHGMETQHKKAGFDNVDDFSGWLLGTANWACDINPRKFNATLSTVIECLNTYEERRTTF